VAMTRRALRHRRRPRRARLALGRMPRERVLSRAGDGHGGAPARPDIIREDRLACLAGRRRCRPQLPKRRALAPRRSARARRVLPGSLERSPSRKAPRRLGRGVDATGEGGLAPLASPSLSPGGVSPWRFIAAPYEPHRPILHSFDDFVTESGPPSRVEGPRWGAIRRPGQADLGKRPLCPGQRMRCCRKVEKSVQNWGRVRPTPSKC